MAGASLSLRPLPPPCLARFSFGPNWPRGAADEGGQPAQAALSFLSPSLLLPLSLSLSLPFFPGQLWKEGKEGRKAAALFFLLFFGGCFRFIDQSGDLAGWVGHSRGRGGRGTCLESFFFKGGGELLGGSF